MWNKQHADSITLGIYDFNILWDLQQKTAAVYLSRTNLVTDFIKETKDLSRICKEPLTHITIASTQGSITIKNKVLLKAIAQLLDKPINGSGRKIKESEIEKIWPQVIRENFDLIIQLQKSNHRLTDKFLAQLFGVSAKTIQRARTGQ